MTLGLFYILSPSLMVIHWIDTQSDDLAIALGKLTF